jgi:hypothetical protein
MKKERYVIYLAILTLIAIGLSRVQMADQDAAVAAEIATSSPTPHVSSISAVKPVVYNYSVIPGGVANVADFCNQIQSDAAFQGFNCNVAYETLLRSPIAVFMTFKKNGHIYWTKHLVTVKAGELIYTDGQRSFLARCGNEIGFALREPSMQIDESLLSQPSAPAADVSLVSLAPSDSYAAAAVEPGALPVAPAGVVPASGAARSSVSPAWLATAAAVPLLIWHGGGGNQSPAIPPPPKCDSVEVSCAN